MKFQISSQAIDPGALLKGLGDHRAGACVSFEGCVRNRNDGREVRALEYEAYAAVAEKEGERILTEAGEKFSILAIGCVHRTGMLALGEVAVWVGVAAEHRGAAFDACRYVIDQTKLRVPIWKKEHYAGGASEWIGSVS